MLGKIERTLNRLTTINIVLASISMIIWSLNGRKNDESIIYHLSEYIMATVLVVLLIMLIMLILAALWDITKWLINNLN